MVLKITISAPSKTFLLGEYAALYGFPALVLATPPRFLLTAIRVEEERKGFCHGINSKSPAGGLIREYFSFYSLYDLFFEDPYHDLGGFGASTAQFLLLYALQFASIDEKTLLKTYIKNSWDRKGFCPSGADLIGQLHGKLCWVENQTASRIFEWPFHDIAFCLISTENKLATYEHLKNLKPFDPSSLQKCLEKAWTSLERKESSSWLEVISEYYVALLKLGLVDKKTEALIKEFSNSPAVLASKGCGALGADVLLVLFCPEKKPAIEALLKQKNLRAIHWGPSAEKGMVIEHNGEKSNAFIQ